MYFKGFKSESWGKRAVRLRKEFLRSPPLKKVQVGEKDSSGGEKEIYRGALNKKGDHEGRPILLITYGCPDEQ